MGLNDGAGDRQSQARAIRGGVRAGRVRTVKTVEQPGQGFRGNGGAGVFHRDLRRLRRLGNPNVNVPTLVGMAQGIGQKIAQGAAKHQAVAMDHTVADQLEMDVFFLCHGLIKIEEGLRFQRRRKRFLAWQVHAALGFGEQQHVDTMRVRRCSSSALDAKTSR